MINKKGEFLDQSKISKILELLRSGGGGKIKFQPLTSLPPINKIVIENSPPNDNPNALAYVTNGSDDIHLILPAIEKSIKEQVKSKGLDLSELNSIDLSNLENNPKLNTIIIILSAALQIFSHELGHLKEFNNTGELKSEDFAESEAKRSLDTMKVSYIKGELRKLASDLDKLGETSYVKDVFLIESMLPKESEVEKNNNLTKEDLIILSKSIEKSLLK